jgi:predicted SAM-dependent methyltransferase
VKLNLGCGLDIRRGYINIDVRRTGPNVLVMDLEREFLRPFPDESAEEVVCKDFLEHLSWRVVEDFLRDVHRVLRRGGRLLIQCPDLEAIAKKVILDPSFKYGGLEGWRAISFWVYGAQDYPENAHRAGFTQPTMRALLERVGFKVERLESDGGTNMLAVAVKP